MWALGLLYNSALHRSINDILRVYLYCKQPITAGISEVRSVYEAKNLVFDAVRHVALSGIINNLDVLSSFTQNSVIFGVPTWPSKHLVFCETCCTDCPTVR